MVIVTWFLQKMPQLQEMFPIVEKEGSDSMAFDNVLEVVLSRKNECHASEPRTSMLPKVSGDLADDAFLCVRVCVCSSLSWRAVRCRSLC